ncbi:tafazzin [Colletotrichum navitas]|uniref:Tafazzin n=1 Tax=Colletotrichum navitas TaxID=681940 RepID=A0AAD8Q673_9PEZI|nr:tafazzin [Colletotrichum navitas]KAK1596394.1 tafazzin [Colletotrichum navitas]
MPKKRHQALYSKPQSTAPSSLGASASASSSSRHQRKGVNELLADLRRSSPRATSTASAAISEATAPTVPPALRQILQIPETPPPPPRRAPRFDTTGRRVPPGPPPPRSWLSRTSSHAQRAHATAAQRGAQAIQGLPGTYEPDKGSLMDIVLRRMALNWELQRDYDQYYLHMLPSRSRASLARYVGVWYEGGVSAADLRNILIPPPPPPSSGYDDGSEHQQPQVDAEALVSLNSNIYSLDLTGSVGHSMSVRELSDVLFPSKLARASEVVQDSWDTAEAPSLPPKLLPNITHLCLAVAPSVYRQDGGPGVSWRQLLALAGKLPTLTHLSLAYWPEPSMTPNAKFTTIVSPEGVVQQYSGTGAYAHTLDNDWSEAVILLRKLSKCLYGLEYLDLTGCGAWFKALMANVDGDKVDWGGPWGKVSTLKLRYGYEVSKDTPIVDSERYRAAAEAARSVEKYIVAQRAGKGRFINVDSDAIDDAQWPSMS